MATVQDLVNKVRNVAGVIDVKKIDERDLRSTIGRKDYFYAVTYTDPNDPERLVVQNFVIYELYDSQGNPAGAYFADKPAILNVQNTNINRVTITVDDIVNQLNQDNILAEGVQIINQGQTQKGVYAEAIAYVKDTTNNVVVKKTYFFKKEDDGKGNYVLTYYELA